MLPIMDPKHVLCKLIVDSVLKNGLSIHEIQAGLHAIVPGISATDYEKYANMGNNEKTNVFGESKKFIDEESHVNSPVNKEDSEDSKSLLTIHVFDGTRKTQRDFTCSKDILLREMKYFTSFLHNSTDQSKQVDIAVHCDLDIFGWLMNYAKRPETKTQDTPSFLQPSNWISVLISAFFLQMDGLVNDCISYCKERIDEIVLSASSFHCLDDDLIGRISDTFSPQELDQILDPKDKIKSKLFAKKVSSMFEPSNSSKAPTFFRCSACKALVSNIAAHHIACVPSRTTVNRNGSSLHAIHSVDRIFKVDEFILDVKKNRSWSEVFWILWSCINHLTCTRCSQVFMCHNIMSCIYHSELPKSGSDDPQITTFPCCGHMVNTFEPLQSVIKQGCRVRDHVVNLPPSADLTIYQDLINHKDIISSYMSQRNKPNTSIRLAIELFGVEENQVGQAKKTASSIFGNHSQNTSKSLPLDGFEEGSLGSDGNSADEEQFSRAKDKTNKAGKDCGSAINRNACKEAKWDVTKSLRYNQDAQRQEDQKKMKELAKYLTSLRFTQEDINKYKHKTFEGGIFSRLETQWKIAHASSSKFNQPSNIKLFSYQKLVS